MSAYAHQMEREFSAQSLSSRGGSELESRYAVESGFYMTSFAATIFITGLGIVGVLMVAMLIALTVMLQSCQNSSKGIVETQNLSGIYGYCKVFEQHAELNSLGPDDLPSMCRSLANQETKEEQYERNLNTSLWLVERYFDGVVPSEDGLSAILIDIDDILATDLHYAYSFMHRLFQYGCSGYTKETKQLKEMLFLRLYLKLQARGWSLILLSRKPQNQQNTTIEYLMSSGYRDWSSVIMRLNEEMAIDIQEYFLRKRMQLQKKGFRISGVISSQMDTMTGRSLAELAFKLPNPIYYFCHHRENTHNS